MLSFLCAANENPLMETDNVQPLISFSPLFSRLTALLGAREEEEEEIYLRVGLGLNCVFCAPVVWGKPGRAEPSAGCDVTVAQSVCSVHLIA